MGQGERVNTVTDHGCFGCGVRNPIGLRLEFFQDGEDRIRAAFTPRSEHEGYSGMVHGGILSTLLDEAMSWAVTQGGRLAVTVRMEVRFRRPVRVGTPVTVVGAVKRDRGRIVQARAEVQDATGDVLAEATGTFAAVSAQQQAAWEDLYLNRRSK